MIEREIVVVIPGQPAPKGSMKCVGRNGSHQLIEDNARTKPWRKKVGEWSGGLTARAVKTEPIGVEITSTIPRYATHFAADGSVKDSAPDYPLGARTGDVDKLARLVLDALQDAGIVANDSQVVEVTSRKSWPGSELVPDALEDPGVVIRIYPYGRAPDE